MLKSIKQLVLFFVSLLIATCFTCQLYSQELAIRLVDERGEIVKGRVAYPCFDPLAIHRELLSAKELEQSQFRSGSWIIPELDFPWQGDENLLIHSPYRDLRIVKAIQSINVTLRDPGVQFIRFVDREGKPVSKATLQVVGIQRPIHSKFYRIPLTWEKDFEFLTNDQGICQIPRIAKDHRWLLELKVPFEASRGMTLTDDEWEGYRKQVREFVVEPGSEMRVAPKDGDKRLASGWKARLIFSGPSDEKIITNAKGQYVKFGIGSGWQMNLNGFQNSTEPVPMNDDGSFVFRNVPDGKYQIRFEHDKFQHQIAIPMVEKFVSASTANVEYRVDTPVTLKGEVAGLDDSYEDAVILIIESIGYSFLGRPTSSGNFEMLVPNARLSVEAWGAGIEALNQPELPDFEESRTQLDIGTIHLQSMPNLCKGHLGPKLRNYMVQQPDFINLQVEGVPISVDDNFRFAVRLRGDPSGEDFHGFLRSSEHYQLEATRNGDEWELELPELERFQSIAPRFRVMQPDGTPLFPARLSLTRIEQSPPFIPQSFGSIFESDSSGEFFVIYNEHRVAVSGFGQNGLDSEPVKIEWQCIEEFTPAGTIPSIGKIGCEYGKLSDVSHDFVLSKRPLRGAAFRAKLLDRFGKPETGTKGWLCQSGDFPIQVITDGAGEFSFDVSQGLGFLFLADSSRILPVRIHEAGIEVNANENLIDSTELAKPLSEHMPSKTRHSKFSLEETLLQLIDLGSDLPKEDHAMDLFHIGRRYGIDTLLDFDAMLIKVAAIASRVEREKVVLPLANWWLPRDSGKWNAMLNLSKDPLVRGEIMSLAANHSTTVQEKKVWLLQAWKELQPTSHGFLKGRIALDMLRIGDASFIEQCYAAMVASSDELQGEASPLQTQIVTSDSFEQQMLRYSVQSPEDLHDAIMDQKCMIPSAWLALSYRDEKLAGITAGLLAKSLARNEYLQYASDQRRWIYERATTIVPELRNDFRLLYGSNQLPFDDLEWMPKNDDLKFDLIQRCIGKIEMQDWAPSDDAGWRLLLEWHRCQANSLVDRTLLDAQYQSSRAISLENLPTLAEKIPAEKKELVWLASLITFAPNWGTEILQKQDFRYACMQVQAMNFLYDHSPDIASLIDQVIIEDRTLDDLFAHGQLGDYFWRDYLRYDSKACIEALRKRSKIDLNLDEASLQYRIERKHLLIRDLMLSLRDCRDSPSR